LSNAVTSLIHIPEVVAATQVTAITGLLIQIRCPVEVLGNSATGSVHIPKVSTATHHPTITHFLVEVCCTGKVSRTTGPVSVCQIDASWHCSTVASLLVEANSSVHVPDNSLPAVVPHTKVVTGQWLSAITSLLVEARHSSKILRNPLAVPIPIPIPISQVQACLHSTTITGILERTIHTLLVVEPNGYAKTTSEQKYLLHRRL
jgi:hypothetical protein